MENFINLSGFILFVKAFFIKKFKKLNK